MPPSFSVLGPADLALNLCHNFCLNVRECIFLPAIRLMLPDGSPTDTLASELCVGFMVIKNVPNCYIDFPYHAYCKIDKAGDAPLQLSIIVHLDAGLR